MIIIKDGEVMVSAEDEDRNQHTCPSCGAVGFGNMTCRRCVSEWPRFGIPQDSVDELLKIIGDRPPRPPYGTRFH